MNILMMLTDGFGCLGGISRFNRDFLQALDASNAVNRVRTVPRIISDPIYEAVPEFVVYDRKAARGKIAFVQRAVAHAWNDNRMELVICGHINLLPVAFYVAKHRRARLVLIIHGIEAWQPSSFSLTNRLTRTIDGFIAVSRLSAEKFTHWSGVSMDRGFVLPNCVDLDRFVPQARDQALVDRYGLSGDKVIMTLGRLAAQERYKGFDETLDAMPALTARYPDLKYLIVGDGEDGKRLKSKARALGVDRNVIFTGRIPESEKVAHYSLADAYVMPSSGEGFGIVLIEAAACGIPVIGSNADGSREALLGGRLGRLVDPRDRPQLVEAVSQTLESNPPRLRLAEIATFGVDQFRARVDRWAREQFTACFPRHRAA